MSNEALNGNLKSEIIASLIRAFIKANGITENNVNDQPVDVKAEYAKLIDMHIKALDNE